MPREDRRLIFDFEEAYRAIYALSVQKEMRKPPQGVITNVTQDPGDANKFTVQIDNPLQGTGESVSYSQDFLAAALMLYCRTCGIPLPKKGQKSVILIDKTVILRITI
jgi:hypothetical protein